MNPEPQPDSPYPDGAREARERAEIVADMQEDRRRQRELDDGEMGGEA